VQSTYDVKGEGGGRDLAGFQEIASAELILG